MRARIAPIAVALLALAVFAAGCERSGTLSEQAAAMASVNPPPRASERPRGVHVEPCDLGVTLPASEVEGESYYCGTFTVPQDWDAPDGPRIDLAFVVAKATGEAPEPDPLVFLAGGPGQSATLTALTAYEGVRPSRDIVRLDQRGAGLSQRIGLEECLVLALQDEGAETEVETVLQAMQAADRAGAAAEEPEAEASRGTVKATVNQLCWDQFAAQGLDLDAFTTWQSARDVVELLKALEYTRFNLHGISYGTRLAMTIMRGLDRIEDAPELRAVVLDSPFPPSELLLSRMPRNFHEPVIRLFEECRTDPVCAAAYPDLQARFQALLARLQAEPLVIEADTIRPSGLLRTVVDLRGTRAGYMPRMIAEVETGNLATYRALGSRELGAEPPEDVGGLDADDPAQAYLAAVMSVLGAGGEITQGVKFAAEFQKAVGEEEPVPALERYIRDEYPAEVRDRLLALTAELRPEDLEGSALVAQIRAEVADASPPSPEEQEAAKARADRTLAVIGVAQFLNTNIHCAEDLQLETLEDGLAALDALAIPQLADRDELVEQAGRCESWPVEPQPRSVADPVASDVPTLILQGTYDTKTPLFMGREAARQLSRSTLAIVPQQGHEIWVRSNGCAARVATAFVLDPTSTPDLSCLEARRPHWALPNGG